MLKVYVLLARTMDFKKLNEIDYELSSRPRPYLKAKPPHYNIYSLKNLGEIAEWSTTRDPQP